MVGAVRRRFTGVVTESTLAASPPGSTVTGPTALSARALAPDLARGAMLLFIALANSHHFLRSGETLRGFPTDGSVLDSTLAAMLATFVDGRAYPLFALLFGYGLVQILHRQQAAGVEWRPTRKLLRRRSLWMIPIGFLHGTLLYVGDIIAAYGLLGVLLVGVVRWKGRTLLFLAGLVFVLLSLPSDDSWFEGTGDDPAMYPVDPITGFVERSTVLPILVPLEAIGLLCPFLLGIWAARRRILEEPHRHPTLLRTVAGAGLGAAVLGGLPMALVVAGAVDMPAQPTWHLLGTLHDATGYLGGPGYAAAIALLAVRIGQRRGPTTLAVSAVGQRSMTCYLSQSVIWTVAFAPFALDLSRTLTVTTTALLATCTWLLTVGMAELMRRADQRGPFEVLLRRLAYRTRKRAT